MCSITFGRPTSDVCARGSQVASTAFYQRLTAADDSQGEKQPARPGAPKLSGDMRYPHTQAPRVAAQRAHGWEAGSTLHT